MLEGPKSANQLLISDMLEPRAPAYRLETIQLVNHNHDDESEMKRLEEYDLYGGSSEDL